ncbi:MAG: nickel pincer cofactor biosynthesis protein LarC [Verrucomicrobiota bacterium]
MNTLYLDIFSGISGDMFLGAMIDLGVDLHQVERELGKLALHDYHLHAHRAKRGQIEGVKFDVHLGDSHQPKPEHGHEHQDGHGHEHGHEHPHEHGHVLHHSPRHEHGPKHSVIKGLIARSALSPWIKEKSLAVFQRVAAAEGKIHGLPAADVHFHEVGALDSIVDIVGGCVALEILGRPRVLASAVVDGSGWVECAHGRFPIPAPATLEILAARGVAITQCEEPHELVTPTGAALLAEFAESFGPMRGLAAARVGLGVGSRENKTRPNVLRAILAQGGPAPASPHEWETDTIAVLETNLDDTSPEILGHFVETALAAGALDVFYAPVQMKKNRPGVLLSVLCAPERAESFGEMILRQTSAFGVRRSLVERWKLRREFRSVPTPLGQVTLKLGFLDGRLAQVAPEFESCKKLAAEKNLPLAEVYRAALAAWKPD